VFSQFVSYYSCINLSPGNQLIILKFKIMALNLLNSVRGLLSGDLISRASTTLNEDEARVQNAMSGIVPSVLTGIINKAGSGNAGSILSMAKDTANSGMLSGIGNFLGNNSLLDRGSDMLRGIFGNRLNDVINMIASFAGIRSTSAASLMSVAAPAALGTLGAHAISTNMNERTLVSFLDEQKDSILNALPSGLNLAGALGVSSLGNIGSTVSNVSQGASAQVRDMPRTMRRSSGTRWLVPALVLLAFVGLLWYFISNRKDSTRENVSMSNRAEPGVIASPPPSGETVKVKLPNGVVINAYKNGIEDRLVDFLDDRGRQVDNSTWFDFDKLNFETGSSTITAESMPQIRNIAAILKAFPNASIKIGGYTDATGDKTANRKLSQSRAEAVVAELKNNGITDAQLAGAEGYGSQFAKAPANASDEQRRMDRRISVSVRKK
jgi:outer membrane protein OmpA-like peptidoglycan-associated protein